MTLTRACLLTIGAVSFVSANCDAAITFYEFDNNAWTTAPTFGANAESAWKNYNWGQNANAIAATGPTGGSATGAQPAAYSIWKVSAPQGQALTSVVVHTRANFEKDTTGLNFNNLAYVDYALASDGPWTRLYTHDFNKNAWTQDDKTGTITLSDSAADVYIRIAATKYDSTYYWAGDFVKDGAVVGRQSSLRFTELKVTGETVAAVPESASLSLLGGALLLIARRKR